MIFEPVRSVSDFHTLDEGEVLEGYLDGVQGAPSRPDRSRAYWHGWRNGRVDSGRSQPDQAHVLLARAFAELAWNQ